MAVTPSPTAKARTTPRRTPLALLAKAGAPLISFGFVLAIWATVAVLQIVPETIFPAPWSV